MNREECLQSKPYPGGRCHRGNLQQMSRIRGEPAGSRTRKQFELMASSNRGRKITRDVNKNESSSMFVWTQRYLKNIWVSCPDPDFITSHLLCMKGARSGDIGMIGNRKLLVGYHGWLNIPWDHRAPERQVILI